MRKRRRDGVRRFFVIREAVVGSFKMGFFRFFGWINWWAEKIFVLPICETPRISTIFSDCILY